MGKFSHKDAIHYLDLMKEEYELEEKQFDGLYAEWIRNGDIGRELNRIGKQGKETDSRKPYDYVLDGLYENGGIWRNRSGDGDRKSVGGSL